MIEVYTQSDLDKALKSHPDELIICRGSGEFILSGSAQVTAYGSAQVRAYDSAQECDIDGEVVEGVEEKSA